MREEEMNTGHVQDRASSFVMLNAVTTSGSAISASSAVKNALRLLKLHLSRGFEQGPMSGKGTRFLRRHGHVGERRLQP